MARALVNSKYGVDSLTDADPAGAGQGTGLTEGVELCHQPYRVWALLTLIAFPIPKP